MKSARRIGRRRRLPSLRRRAGKLEPSAGFRRALELFKLAAAAVVLVNLLLASAPASAASVDFAELTQALRAFQENPSPETAASVQALLPKEGRLKFDESSQAHAAQEALDDVLPVLGTEVEAVDRDGIRLTLSLVAVTEPPVSDSLEVIMGKLIPINAQVFLQELLRWRTQLTPRALERLVGTLGGDYAEQGHAAVCAEIQRRIDALMAVSEASLLDARNECVNELRQRRPKCG
jgi:hypothetical protein